MFDIEKLSTCIDISFDNEVRVYKDRVHTDIDDLNNNINIGTSSIEKLRDVLSALFPKTKNGWNNKKIYVKHNYKDGYYLKLTSKNAKILQDILRSVTDFNVGGIKIKSCDLEFMYQRQTAKITIPSLNNHADNIEEYREQISHLYNIHYLEDLGIIHNKFRNLFIECNILITKIDYYQSCATLATTFGYCRPELISSDGYFEATNLRHPIIERIIDYEYIPCDIKYDENTRIMLLYGLNSSGKSSLMKSIALATVMAQSGMFVPATYFKTSIFRSLMCRISANDNLQRGLSSFAIEISEINSIIKRSNEKTLVICDEILKSPEHISGVSLVASTIIKLAKLKCISIITTHMHELTKIDEIRSINELKIYHINAIYDPKIDALVYDRKLSEGSGSDFYGIEVAKYMIHDNDFIDTAIIIKNKLYEQHDSIISGKVSNYNKDLYVHSCTLCGIKDNIHITNLETHHIVEQHKFDENDIATGKKHIKKNDLGNLVVLCDKCHKNIHNNGISLNLYKKTTKGKKILGF